MKGSVLSVMLKGLCVGSTMMVPGVSGGSMAMLLGIYDRLIYSVNSIRSVKSLLLLGTFSAGGFIGIPPVFPAAALPVGSLSHADALFFYGGGGRRDSIDVKESGGPAVIHTRFSLAGIGDAARTDTVRTSGSSCPDGIVHGGKGNGISINDRYCSCGGFDIAWNQCFLSASCFWGL